ncbi:MAG: CPBP family intramembrane metalloprotease [Acidimicrobiia bacterium]|nr:CPBP family intramembrane metalloprotease [Acidimicrobiia bacterium]
MASSSQRRQRARLERRRAASTPTSRRQQAASDGVDPEGVDPADGSTAMDEHEPSVDGPAEATTAAGDRDPDGPRWGLGDVLTGWGVSLVASTVAVLAWVNLSSLPQEIPGVGFDIGYALARGDLGLAAEIYRTAFDFDFTTRAMILQVPLWLGLIGVPVVAAWRKGTSLRVDFGLSQRARDVPIGLAIGVACQVGVVLFYNAISWLVDPEEVAEPAREVVASAADPVGLVVLVAVVGFGAPFAEELFYRGLTMRALCKRGMTAGWSIVLTAMFFAIAHLQSLQFPALVAVGVVFGVLAHRTGRLGPAIWAHVGFNLTTVAVLSGLVPVAG